MASTLGLCGQCGGDLCLRPETVACAACGLPHPDHPETLRVLAEIAEAKRAAAATGARKEASRKQAAGEGHDRSRRRVASPAPAGTAGG